MVECSLALIKDKTMTLLNTLAFSFIVNLLWSCASPEQLQAQDVSRFKEPPLPVIMRPAAKDDSSGDGELITLSIADFNAIMEREDSLRRVYSEQAAKSRDKSDLSQFLLYVLVGVLVISNLATWRIATNRNQSLEESIQRPSIEPLIRHGERLSETRNPKAPTSFRSKPQDSKKKPRSKKK
jgi:hypothetical protein